MPEPIFTLLRRTYAFKKTTDCDIHLDVYSSEEMAKISPAVVWIHGGALIMGSRENGQSHAARYVDAGYKVISIDYRLTPETKLPEIIADVRDAFGWIRSNADELGVDPAKDPEFFTPYCPDQNIDANYPPTLLLHGTDDTDVPYELSVRMQNRLKEAGVDHEMVTIEGGGHGFDGRWWDPRVKAAFARVLGFLDNHLN
ncbi:MAG: alpha/beta hydrolase [Gemmatimonadetes bacterium]|nr:alpha/beta hydrolase [Gemmatimonadota bacterium]